MKDKKWTLHNIPDQSGKVILVTGGNSGLGYESVKVLVQKNAEVILASRSLQKGEAAKSDILKSKSNGKIRVMQLDLMDLTSIQDFAKDVILNYNRLDVLLNNAGIMMSPYGLTKDGFESQLGTNHLGHFALTGLLLELLRKTIGARIVNVASNAHKYGKMDFDDMLYKNGKDYSPTKSYARSKLANLLFTYELARRIENNNLEIISVAAHPGIAATNLARYMEHKWWFKFLKPIAEFMLQNQANGALSQIRASVDTNVKSGEYYGPSGLRQAKGDPVLVQSNEASHNRDDAKRLWEESEKLTGVKYLN